MTGHLYVHVPFCRRKCAYCAFYSEADADAATIDRYLRRLGEECRAAAAQAGPLQTLYIGGGTPTLLDVGRLRALLATLRLHFRLAPEAEASIECNPESLDDSKAEILAANGINRVSLGVQSFQPEFRRRLGRHGPLPIRRAVTRLRRHGIGRLGIDLIYGIPGQTLADWAAELAMAIDLGVGHVSAYALTREEGTRLARRCRRTGEPPADDDLLADMWHLAGERLAVAGLQRYEISNYARPGEECRHNQAVWHGAPLLGLGPAAAGFDGDSRWSSPPSLTQWLVGAPAQEDRLPRPARAREILAFGLRTAEGWDEHRCREATGHPWHAWRGRLQPLIEAGLLAVDGTRLHPTERGLLLWDTLAEAIV